MSDNPIERIYEESWQIHLNRGKGHVTETNQFGEAIAGLVGTRQNVLDIGCGTGKCVIPVAGKGNRVIGVDVSEHALQVLRQLGFQAMKMDIEHEVTQALNEFAPFDVILMTDVLEHLIDPLQVLHEKVAPLLRPAGRCIATVPNFVYITYRVEFVLGRISHFNNYGDITGHAIPRPYNLGHKTLFNQWNLVQTFTRAGFSSVTVVPELFSDSLTSFWRIRGLRQLRDGLKKVWPTLLAARFLVIAEK